MKATKLRISEIIIIAITLLSLALSIFYYPRLPAKMPYHWDTEKNAYVIGYNSRLVPTFAITATLVGILLLYLVIPRLRKRNADDRFRYYDRLVLWIFATQSVPQFYFLISGFKALNYTQTKIAVMTTIGALFFLLGDTFAHAKPGWFIAIAHRGVMKHTQVWENTHKSIGKWLKATALACLPAIILPFKYAFYASIYMIGACILVVYYYYFFYPYFLHRKLEKTSTPEDQSKLDKDKT